MDPLIERDGSTVRLAAGPADEVLSGGICSLDPMIGDACRVNDRSVQQKRGTT
jgi:hypothetical protein